MSNDTSHFYKPVSVLRSLLQVVAMKGGILVVGCSYFDVDVNPITAKQGFMIVI